MTLMVKACAPYLNLSYKNKLRNHTTSIGETDSWKLYNGPLISTI